MVQKIESKANKCTFVQCKTIEKNCPRLMDKIKILLEQIDEAIAQESTQDNNRQSADFMVIADELNRSLQKESEPATKGEKRHQKEKRNR